MDMGIYPHTVVQIPRKTGGKACYCGADCGYIRVTAEHWKTTCLVWWVPTSLSFRFKLNIYVDTRDILNYYKTVLLRDTIHQTSSGESADTVKYQGWYNLRSAPATDSLREFWWTVSHNNTVLFLSRDFKTTKINQYSPVVLVYLNVPNSRFQKHILIWMWRHLGIVLWRHYCGAWHNALLLTTTASNVNCWADVANHVARLWQAGDTENFKRQITVKSCPITGWIERRADRLH